MPILDLIHSELAQFADPLKAEFFPKFFKFEPGNTDKFLGVKVPVQRTISKKYFKEISLKETLELLHSEFHEARLTALFILVLKFQKGDARIQKEIYEVYLQNTKWVDNWDLVDSSASYIVGAYIFDKDQSILNKLSCSKNVWERRTAIVATWYFIRKGEFAWTLKLAEQYLDDYHHYIHKATGWMLREVGKRDRAVLVDFLNKNAARMPRTALRYAIEHFDPESRSQYLTMR